jgi:hypothetical protein
MGIHFHIHNIIQFVTKLNGEEAFLRGKNEFTTRKPQYNICLNVFGGEQSVQSRENTALYGSQSSLYFELIIPRNKLVKQISINYIKVHYTSSV